MGLGLVVIARSQRVARSAPDDRLRDEAIQGCKEGLDCFASLAMTELVMPILLKIIVQ
jgi:hypothetical protein